MDNVDKVMITVFVLTSVVIIAVLAFSVLLLANRNSELKRKNAELSAELEKMKNLESIAEGLSRVSAKAEHDTKMALIEKLQKEMKGIF